MTANGPHCADKKSEPFAVPRVQKYEGIVMDVPNCGSETGRELYTRHRMPAAGPALRFQVGVALQAFFVEAQQLAGLFVSHAVLTHGALDVFA